MIRVLQGMPIRRGYDREKEGEGESLLEQPLPLASLHYKKSEEHGSPGRRQPPDTTIQCDIQPKDTLLSLSLKYNVPIAELKRVNNILTDQGFYALKRIKIPVRPYSLLLPDVHGEQGRNNNGWVVESGKPSPTSRSSDLSSRVSTACSSPYSELGEEEGDVEDTKPLFHESKDKKKVKRLLKDMDRDLSRIREKQQELGEVPAATHLIKEPIRLPLPRSSTLVEESGWSNRVLGCWCLVVALLILLVFVVLVALVSTTHDHDHDTWDQEKPTAEHIDSKLT